MKTKGLFYVELKLDIVIAKKVEVFGDFVASKNWKQKIACEKINLSQW